MNHVLANLDSVMRDGVKLLQISGNMRLETLLEFIDSKFHNNTLQIQTFAHHASLPFTYQNPSNHASPIVQKTNQNDDIQEMKTMMKKLIDLQVNQHSAVRPPYQNRQRICNVCNKTGHTGDKCYLTKTCFICNQKGHISRNCTANTTPPGQSQGNVSTNAGKTREDLNENIQSNSFQKIKSVERILVNTVICGVNVLFLYDPGSEYTILLRVLYDSLPSKPPLLSIDSCGVGIDNSKFTFDGVAYLNIDFYREDGSCYTLPYETVLVSSNVSQPIFGIHTEYKFKAVERNHENKELLLHTKDSQKIKINYLQETKSGINSAYIQVARATIIRDNEINFVKSKVKGYTKDIGNDSLFVFEGSEDIENVKFNDFKIEGLNSTVQVQVFNNSGCDIKLKKGEKIGVLNKVEIVESVDAVSVAECSVSENYSVGDLMTSTEREKFDLIINNYKSFMDKRPITEPCKIPIEHSINLVDDVPVSLPPRRIPISIRNEVKEKISDLLKRDIIEPSSSPYGAPLVPVLKRNGNVRLYFDYRQLNAKTIPNKYPIRRPNDIFGKLKSAKVFSVIDLKNGYYHIPVKAKDRCKTAFILPWCKMQFKRMSVGLLGAPFTFSEGIDFVIHDIDEFCDGFFDDMIVFSDSVSEHLKHLEIVFKKLADYGLSINYYKCQFIQRSVKFLGHIITSEGLFPSSENSGKILNFVVPTDKDKLRSFLGMASFYKNFIENFSTLAAPLFYLTKQNIPFLWTEECENSFNKIKNSLESPTFLSYPDCEKPFILQVDASGQGLGYVLSQEKNGKLLPVKFGGRVLSNSEKRYDATNRELLAVYYSVKQNEVYLFRNTFYVYTPIINL